MENEERIFHGPITGELSFGTGASKLELGRDSESEVPLLGYPSQALREAATEVASLTSGFKGWPDLGTAILSVTKANEQSGGTLLGSMSTRGSILTLASESSD